MIIYNLIQNRMQKSLAVMCWEIQIKDAINECILFYIDRIYNTNK